MSTRVPGFQSCDVCDLDVFQKTLHPCAWDERSLSIGRVKIHNHEF